MKGALKPFVEALIRYQDEESGLWYQVVDKGSEADNWLETSCTSLFVYTIAKAIRCGAVGEECRRAALHGYEGLVRRTRSDAFGLVVPEICIGTSAGEYTNFVTRPVSEKDLHGRRFHPGLRRDADAAGPQGIERSGRTRWPFTILQTMAPWATGGRITPPPSRRPSGPVQRGAAARSMCRPATM
ncbi:MULTISPECIES: glycoside hydrolase family 88 protein [Paenibacillus]|uniref:glycoside hydrolase family 88 protein n=1 Tax=Paenibacillus TaxID=44249 RepID=UPI0022B8A06F|nr:glycoside hydrolase family 88 protein [Paenibacillus caseinilyticus]MCZ8522119.1 glycoside hydrolase family 88 protein [Paenibacillus caseinilyticus]